MAEQQGDLFSGGFVVDRRGAPNEGRQAIAWDTLADEDLFAALDDAGMTTCVAVAAEIGRRKPSNATAVLESLCRRFCGFGLERIVPEQAAALDALLAIGDRQAAEAAGRLIMHRVVQGSALRQALAAAAKLGTILPPEALLPLLRHDDPDLRANACRCIHGAPSPEIVNSLFELLDDLNERVSDAAGCALGRVRQRNALGFLVRRLRERPSADIVEAVAPIADPESIVLLSRIGQENDALRSVIIETLEAIDHPLAEKLATRLRREAHAG